MRHLSFSLPHDARKILVVEDDAVQALDLDQSLRRLGHRVLGPVATVAEAEAVLARERPNLALLDLGLRDGDGLPVAQQLVAAEVPFAVATGLDGALLEHPLLRGCPLLRKPYGAAELQAAVRGLQRLDLLRALAGLDRRVAQAWDRITRQAGTISRLAAGGHDTRLGEALLRTFEETLAILEQHRQRLLRDLGEEADPPARTDVEVA